MKPTHALAAGIALALSLSPSLPRAAAEDREPTLAELAERIATVEKGAIEEEARRERMEERLFALEELMARGAPAPRALGSGSLEQRVARLERDASPGRRSGSEQRMDNRIRNLENKIYALENRVRSLR